jgi:citrate lyase subunit beta/citryl-CoA lyase
MTSYPARVARLRRSALYMPASNARALEKARTLPADALIFDLEDAVAPSAKGDARELAVRAAQSKNYGAREVLIRANGLDTNWMKDDLKAIAASGADGVVVPKINGPDDVRLIDELLTAAGAPATLAIWAMMETPRGILAAADVATSSARLAGFLMGTADLAKELHCAHPGDRAPMLYALQHCILVARAYGLLVLDGIHFELDDEAGFRAACEQGRALGFAGKTLIHPRQIAGANAAFAPSAAEVVRAQGIVTAYAEAAARGQGVTVLDGRLVEELHVREAERLLALAQLTTARESL